MSVLAGDDYLKFCDGLRQLTGVDLTQYKRPQMERRLRSFLERRGFRSLSESLPSLRNDKAELEALLDRMTINVSQLWRNPEHWQVLEKTILPSSAPRVGCGRGAPAPPTAPRPIRSPLSAARSRLGLGSRSSAPISTGGWCSGQGRRVQRRGRSQRATRGNA